MSLLLLFGKADVEPPPPVVVAAGGRRPGPGRTIYTGDQPQLFDDDEEEAIELLLLALARSLT